jgi:hypothetical protein
LFVGIINVRVIFMCVFCSPSLIFPIKS